MTPTSYDVYIALLNNGVIDLEQLREEDASELERKFFQIFLKKKSEVVQGIEKDLRELSTKYNELGIENQEYQSFIIDCSLRPLAVANAFFNGRYAEQNGRSYLVDC
ncbi:hypothetical protein ACTM9K_17035 [Bariatricus sp. HCP3S3_E12]|uniref:hypothetical protein n=1 Tax=Bariatricus sp. HCP3S3_E12 TaxID=3438906 RepID=UPI003F8AEFF3